MCSDPTTSLTRRHSTVARASRGRRRRTRERVRGMSKGAKRPSESVGEGVAVIGARLSQRRLVHILVTTHAANRLGREWLNVSPEAVRSSYGRISRKPRASARGGCQSHTHNPRAIPNRPKRHPTVSNVLCLDKGVPVSQRSLRTGVSQNPALARHSRQTKGIGMSTSNVNVKWAQPTSRSASVTR